MSTSVRRAFVFTVVSTVVVLAIPSEARAQGDAVDAVRKTMRSADEFLQNNLPTQARATLAQATKQEGALGEFEKDKIDAEFKGWTENFNRQLTERTGENVANILGRLLEQAEGYLSSFRSNPEQSDSYAVDTMNQVAAALADPENKKLIVPDTTAKLLRKIDWLKTEIPKAKTAGWIARVDYPVRMVQEYLDKPVDASSTLDGAFQQIDEALKHCTPTDPATTEFRTKVEGLRKAYNAKFATVQHAGSVQPVIDAWDKRAEKHPNPDNSYETHERAEYEGWESETTPPTFEVFLHGQKEESGEAPADRRKIKGGGRSKIATNPAQAGSLGCERTSAYLSYVVQKWLRNPATEAALAKYPDDPELKRVNAEVHALLEKAGGKVCAFANKLLDEGEKLPPGDDRKTFQGLLESVSWSLDRTVEGCTQLEPTHARIKALEARFRSEENKAEADREAFLESAAKAADASWPELTKSLVAKAKRLDAPAALEKIGDWKGTVVDLVPGGPWAGEYWCIGEVDGVPVCGNLDDDLVKQVDDACTRVGITQFDIEEVFGIVDGACVARERLRDSRGKWSDGSSRDGVRMRVVAVKAKYFAVVLGQSSSLDKVKGAPPATVSPGSSGSSGAMGWIHRLVAWGMCALLGFAGLFALVHGVSKFVAPLEEQKVKLGDALGYVGVAFTALGVVWFLAAIGLSFVGLCRLGSLPSVAMVFAGVACALDLARRKGKLKEETAATLQPLGIVFGLACFGAAALHFLFWDVLLL